MCPPALRTGLQRPRLAAAGKIKTVNVWNPTVANLTLMALGSSAPEILLRRQGRGLLSPLSSLLTLEGRSSR